MTEPSTEQTHHLKTSDTPSGGRGAVLEHLPANDHAGPENGDRGRQRGKQQQQAENGGRDINTDKLWQMRGGQREVCPALAAGNSLPKCPIAAQPRQEPGVDASGEGNLAAHGNSGDGPLEETLREVQGESCTHVDSDPSTTDARQGKKKHRRRPSKKKRRWKPYFKLSWEEKKAMDERETARASRVREEMFAKGLPVAPYNTTQFLMDEHDREEPDLNTETGAGPVNGRTEDTGSEDDFQCFYDNDEEEDEDGSGGGSDGIGRPGNAGGEFLQRDFSETYEKYHVESLQNMSKQELVQEYLELEKCMSRLEEENNRLRRAMEPGPGGLPGPAGSPGLRVRELETELERLRAQLQSQPQGKDRGQVATN